MGRKSLRPYPISTRTSSINAETGTYDERTISRRTSQTTLKIATDKSEKASIHTVDPTVPSSFRELRVRASSPLLGRTYQAQSHSPPPQLPPLFRPSSSSKFLQDKSSEKLAFDAQSHQNLAVGVVDDMRGISFPQLGQGSKSTTHVAEHYSLMPKRKPNKLDLSLLFPKPKPSTTSLLSPQRYTNSPSPVNSDYSDSSVKPSPNKLTKPRSKSNPRLSSQNAPILEEPIPPPMPQIRRPSHRAPMDWFDIPVEKIIRLEISGEDEEAEKDEQADDEQVDDEKPDSGNRLNNAHTPTEVMQPTLKAEHTNLDRFPSVSSTALSSRSSRGSTMISPRTAIPPKMSSRHHLSRQAAPPAFDRTHGSLQSWQSEGDLRSSRDRSSRLSKKKSNSTLASIDLTKNSFLSLSESESESEDIQDTNNGARMPKRRSSTRVPRGSVGTNDYVEPEICHAEAVKGYRLNHLSRNNSNVSSVSSDSRSTARRPIRSRADSLTSNVSRSSVSGKALGSSAKFDIPLIEESEEHVDAIDDNPRLQSRSSHNDIHSNKRRSRIIAVTRQEESLLEAMRLRNGRFTPSIYNDISDSPTLESKLDSKSSAVSSATVSPEPSQANFDTSFLRLSTTLQLSQNIPPTLVEDTSSVEKESYTPCHSVSDAEQKNDNNNFLPSPRLSFTNSESPSTTSTMGHASPITPTLPIHRFSQTLPPPPPPQHIPPPSAPEDSVKHHIRRRTDSSEAIVIEETESDKVSTLSYPLWAVKWTRDSDLAIVH